MCFFMSCEKEEIEFVGIENISLENYPRVDGSTSSSVLNVMVACKMLGISYNWYDYLLLGEWWLQPNLNDISEEDRIVLFERVKTSQTHGAFMNLIDGEADIILTHRTISPDEKDHAETKGVMLIETPIAMDAFVFIVNKNNKVKSLTVEQIQQIYTGKITNWSEVGGNNADINVFTRPRNSGSEEIFRTLVMNGLEPASFHEEPINAMAGVFREVRADDANGICYTFNNYKDMQAREIGRAHV